MKRARVHIKRALALALAVPIAGAGAVASVDPRGILALCSIMLAAALGGCIVALLWEDFR